MFELSSCDQQGSVYLTDDAVYRKIFESEKEKVRLVKSRIDEAHVEGIIKTTEVNESETIPAFLSTENSLVLRHERVRFISYSHEWCASMLRDAALFHIKLSQDLFQTGLYLKDAHPWNILFNQGKPVFVDYTSIVTEEGLANEAYLLTNNLRQNLDNQQWVTTIHWEIFSRMFAPYFLHPLIAYSIGDHNFVRSEIERTTLNVSNSAMQFRDLRQFLTWNKHLFQHLKILYRAKKDIRSAKQNLEKYGVSSFFANLKERIENLTVSTNSSAYSDYYEAKDENQDWLSKESWNAKQRSVYEALNESTIKTTLDVACNTGWFAVLAAKMGKAVVAFDVDEACIEILYRQTKEAGLNIVPLVMSFTNIAEDRLSIHDGEVVLLATEKRLSCDAVLALGIFHHLVLGLGLDVRDVLTRLASFTRNRLIIEYISLDDEKIVGEPDFFPALKADSSLRQLYRFEHVIAILEDLGFVVNIEESYPGTRSILVCDRKEWTIVDANPEQRTN